MSQINETKKLSNADEKGIRSEVSKPFGKSEAFSKSLEKSKTFQKETKKELFTVLDKLRHEVNSSNKNLNRNDNEKGAWFRKKENFSVNIRKKINRIKENKSKRDSLTKKVRELKDKRHNLNEESRKKISELIILKNEVKSLTKKSKVKDPHRIKGDIDILEVKLETEAMPFENEKQLSKKLKQLKKSMSEASAIIHYIDRIKNLNSSIGELRKTNNETHNQIQKLARESQNIHEGILENSKEIDDLKVQELEATKNYFKFKKEFKNINDDLKQKLSSMSKIMEKINKFKLEEEEKWKLNETMLIKSKEQEIEEKIKGGKKLTTDDFLAFQEVIKDKKENRKIH